MSVSVTLTYTYQPTLAHLVCYRDDGSRELPRARGAVQQRYHELLLLLRGSSRRVLTLWWLVGDPRAPSRSVYGRARDLDNSRCRSLARVSWPGGLGRVVGISARERQRPRAPRLAPAVAAVGLLLQPQQQPPQPPIQRQRQRQDFYRPRARCVCCHRANDLGAARLAGRR